HTQTGRARPDPPNLVARNPDQTHRSTQLQCNCLAASMNPPILLKMTVHLNRSGLGKMSDGKLAVLQQSHRCVHHGRQLGRYGVTPARLHCKENSVPAKTTKSPESGC